MRALLVRTRTRGRLRVWVVGIPHPVDHVVRLPSCPTLIRLPRRRQSATDATPCVRSCGVTLQPSGRDRPPLPTPRPQAYATPAGSARGCKAVSHSVRLQARAAVSTEPGASFRRLSKTCFVAASPAMPSRVGKRARRGVGSRNGMPAVASHPISCPPWGGSTRRLTVETGGRNSERPRPPLGGRLPPPPPSRCPPPWIGTPTQRPSSTRRASRCAAWSGCG